MGVAKQAVSTNREPVPDPRGREPMGMGYASQWERRRSGTDRLTLRTNRNRCFSEMGGTSFQNSNKKSRFERDGRILEKNEPMGSMGRGNSRSGGSGFGCAERTG